MYSEWKNESVRNLVKKAVDYRAALMSDGVENLHIKFSFGNSKTGALVPSVSLIPVADCCGNCRACSGGCYDVRHDLTKPQTLAQRANNSAICAADPDRYFSEISRSLFGFRFFRFHVGGDIKSSRYFAGMVRVAVENIPTVKFWRLQKIMRL